jgi:hypothetical protein
MLREAKRPNASVSFVGLEVGLLYKNHSEESSPPFSPNRATSICIKGIDEKYRF